jgi:protein phosphatase
MSDERGLVNETAAAGGQIQGKRQRQEDAWRLVRYADNEVLAAVADGLGGHPAGDVASREGVERFCACFAQRRKSRDGPRHWLQSGVKHAHHELRSLQARNVDYLGMATTLVALYVRGREFWAASVGDSYLLLLRNGELIGLNQLHSEMGGVTSCVGFNLTEIDIADRLLIEPGDRFLLASDGIAVLDSQEIGGLLGAAPDAPAAVKNLLDAIEDAALPAQDNATVVVLLP